MRGRHRLLVVGHKRGVKSGCWDERCGRHHILVCHTWSHSDSSSCQAQWRAQATLTPEIDAA
eukprot:363970-Chlamydomonas_euryale.AAC.21